MVTHNSKQRTGGTLATIEIRHTATETKTSRVRSLAVALAISVIAIFPIRTASAESKIEKAKIQEIDDDGPITFITENGGESLQLDVIRKTKIAIRKKDAKRTELQTGQTATITYDPELSVVTNIDANAVEIPNGQIELFNGNDLDGWKIVVPSSVNLGKRKHECWDVNTERHVLVAKGLASTSLATESTFDNFILTFEWRFPVDAPIGPNGSGVVIRAGELFSNDASLRGIEIEIAETKSGDFICYGTPLEISKRKITGETQQGLGRLADAELKPIGKRNTTEIRCDQDQVTVKFNGQLVNEATGARVKKGEICLRSQNTAVEFRKLRLTPIVEKKNDF